MNDQNNPSHFNNILSLTLVLSTDQKRRRHLTEKLTCKLFSLLATRSPHNAVHALQMSSESPVDDKKKNINNQLNVINDYVIRKKILEIFRIDNYFSNYFLFIFIGIFMLRIITMFVYNVY